MRARSQSRPRGFIANSDEITMKRFMKEFTLLKIHIDEIIIPEKNRYLIHLNQMRQLEGFFLEYSFPSLDSVSTALKTTLRIPEKNANNEKIVFKHKRIVQIKLNEDVLSMWEKRSVEIQLLMLVRVRENSVMRQLAKCRIPLFELVRTPFHISRDFDFVGQEFTGSALIRIELRTKVKLLQERLDSMRNHGDETFVVRSRNKTASRTRGRSSSRCGSRNCEHSKRRSDVSDEENHHPIVDPLPYPLLNDLPLKQAPPSARPSARHNPPTPPADPPRVFSRASTSTPLMDRNNHSSSSSVTSDMVRVPPILQNWQRAESTTEEVVLEGKCSLQLTIHEAVGLPPVKDENGRIISPNAFISVRGREGDLRSQILETTRNPRWEWTAKFVMSAERRNLVIKVLHRSPRDDQPLGFVNLNLPLKDVYRAKFEITDTSQMHTYTSEVPMLVISIVTEKKDEYEELLQSRRNSARSDVTVSSRWRHEETPILQSREEIAEKLRKNVADLDRLMVGMRM